MTTNPYKGGRSNKAPYISTHVRVPENIKQSLQTLSEIYRVARALSDEKGLAQFERDLKKFSDSFFVIEAKLHSSAKLVDEDTEAFIQKEIRHLEGSSEGWKTLCDEERAKQDKVKQTLLAALKLKPNAGGAIKKEIKKALEIIG